MQAEHSNRDVFTSPHSRWLAVAHRVPAAHSSFFYGVKATKVYCRPTCTARVARRANLIFYDTAEQAQRDGFRPCKRCKPDEAGFLGVGEEIAARVIAVMRVKDDDGAITKQSLKELAKEVGVTPSYLCRVFKKTMGVTIGAYRMEFESEVKDFRTESHNNIRGPNVMPAMTEDIPPSHANSLENISLEDSMGHVQESLDINFNFDDWIATEESGGIAEEKKTEMVSV